MVTRRARSEMGPWAAGAVGFAVAVVLTGCEAVLGLGGKTDLPADAGATGDATKVDGTAIADGGADAHPDTATADGACGDTTSSATDCGRCGHSCLGGQCKASVCQPVALTTGNIQPVGIVVDDTSVYWTQPSDGLVMRADKDGANAVTLISTSAPGGRVFFPRYIAADATTLYIADAQSSYVVSCAKTGCGNNPTTVALLATSAQASPNQIGFLAPYVYFTDDIDSVWRALADGSGNPQLLATYAPALPDGGGQTSSPQAIATDSAFVYWTNDDGTVQKAPLDGGAPTLVTTGSLASVGEVALVNGTLYFTQQVENTGTVETALVTGGKSRIVAASQSYPTGITADATNIYWVDQGPLSYNDTHGTVMTCPLASCSAPVVLASGQAQPWEIAVDADAVYWTNYAGITMVGSGTTGAVMKVAKP